MFSQPTTPFSRKMNLFSLPPMNQEGKELNIKVLNKHKHEWSIYLMSVEQSLSPLSEKQIQPYFWAILDCGTIFGCRVIFGWQTASDCPKFLFCKHFYTVKRLDCQTIFSCQTSWNVPQPAILCTWVIFSWQTAIDNSKIFSY